MRSTLKRIVRIAALSVLTALTLAACSAVDDSAQEKEINIQQDTYEKLSKKEPAKSMTNPKTRETINFYTETWNKEGQLAYVYLQNAEGKMIGYYALDGPPVSMCTSLTPTYRIHNRADGDVVTPAPGTDGVYHSGGDCDRYYGKDASTGSYVEFTVGMGINMLLYTEPLSNHPNVENLAPKVEE